QERIGLRVRTPGSNRTLVVRAGDVDRLETGLHRQRDTGERTTVREVPPAHHAGAGVSQVRRDVDELSAEIFGGCREAGAEALEFLGPAQRDVEAADAEEAPDLGIAEDHV